jgi:hypothetical protein
LNQRGSRGSVGRPPRPTALARGLGLCRGTAAAPRRSGPGRAAVALRVPATL